MATIKNIFVANDGTEHATEEAAVAHEKLASFLTNAGLEGARAKATAKLLADYDKFRETGELPPAKVKKERKARNPGSGA